MQPRHLEKAPIREAVVDIQCQLPDDVSVSFLESLHDSIASKYPQKKVRRRIESAVKVEKGEIQATTNDFGVDGFQFISKDSTQIVQFRLDGFTFSRLAPYESWERTRDEALRLWQIYRKATSPISIDRVALRYINQLSLPVAEGNWEHWLIAPPRAPEGVPPRIEFLTRSVFEDPATETVWLLAQGAQRPDSPAARSNVLLDIDVSKTARFDDDPLIWETMEVLREIKNRLFFGSLTDATLETLV